MAKEPEKLSVARLTPFEKGAIRSRVDKYVKQIRHNVGRGKDPLDGIDPVLVLPLDGEFLVTNGTNRVKAMQLCAIESASIKLDYKHDNEIRPYRDALKDHLEKGYRGFEKLPICETDAQRQSL